MSTTSTNTVTSRVISLKASVYMIYRTFPEPGEMDFVERGSYEWTMARARLFTLLDGSQADECGWIFLQAFSQIEANMKRLMLIWS